MKKRIRNALGGITTDPENRIDENNAIYHTYNKLDTQRAKIVNSRGKDLYDIELYHSGERIKNVPVAFPLSKFLFPGKEVILGFIHGSRQQLFIVGAPKYPENQPQTNNVDTESQSQDTTMQKAKMFFDKCKTVFYDNPANSGPFTLSDIFPLCKIHKDLVYDADPNINEIHAPKPHGQLYHVGTIGAWGNVDKTTSSIADLTTKSHTLLTDTGTNTHAQIDSHIGATTSVHATDASGDSAPKSHAHTSGAHDGGAISTITHDNIVLTPTGTPPIDTEGRAYIYDDGVGHKQVRVYIMGAWYKFTLTAV